MGFFSKAAVGSAIVFAALPVAYLMRLLYIRAFSVEEYGLFYAVIAFFSLLSLFASLGTGPALAHLIPKFGNSADGQRLASAAATIVPATTLLTVLCVFLLAPWLEIVFFKVDGATSIVRLMSAYFFFYQISAIPSGIFHGFKQVWLYAGRELFRISGSFLISLIFAIAFELTITHAAIAWVVSHAVMTTTYYVALKIKLPTFKFKRPVVASYRTLLSYGLPTMLVFGAGFLMTMFDTLMITALKTVDEVAAYNVAYPTAQLLIVIITPLSLIILPEISSLFHNNRLGEAQEVIRTVTRIVSSVSVLGTMLLATLSFPVLTILFGAEYAVASPALIILAIGLAASGLATILLEVLGGIGRVGRRAMILNIALGLNIVLNIFLIAPYGYVGAAIATTITYLFLLVLSIMEVQRHGFTTYTLGMLWKLGIPATLGAGTILLIAPLIPDTILTIMIAGGIGIVVYIMSAFLTRGILWSDVLLLWGETKALLTPHKDTH